MSMGAFLKGEDMINRAIVLFPYAINKIYPQRLTSMKTKQQQQAPGVWHVQPVMWVS